MKPTAVTDGLPSIVGLTVHMPWSELMADGIKPLENRSWAPGKWMLGRYLALHASKHWDQQAADFLARSYSRFNLEPTQIPRREDCKAGIIAVARVGGWIKFEQIGPPRVIELQAGEQVTDADYRWFFGQGFGWLLRDVKRITPVPAMGRQKLWRLEAAVYEQVRRRYGRGLTV